MKHQQLRKRLLVESAVIGGGVVTLGAVVFFLSMFSGDYEKGNQELENKVNGIAASTTTLSSKYDKVRQNDTLFKKIVQLQAEDGLSINQQVAKNRFNHLRDQYYLSNLHLSMSPITEMQDPAYRRVTNTVVSSDVTVDFEGLSDEFAYSLIDGIEQELPGSSKIVSLTLTRQGLLTNDVLRVISERGTSPLVKGEVKFMWLGIKPVEPSDAPNAPKKP